MEACLSELQAEWPSLEAELRRLGSANAAALWPGGEEQAARVRQYEPLAHAELAPYASYPAELLRQLQGGESWAADGERHVKHRILDKAAHADCSRVPGLLPLHC